MQRLTEAPRVFNLEGDLTPQRLRENYSLVQLREMSVQYRFGILWAEAAYADGSLSLNDLRKMQKSAAEKQILIALVIAEKKQKR